MNYAQLAKHLMDELAKKPELGNMNVNICVGKDDYREIEKLESIYRFGVSNGQVKMTGVELAFYPEGITG